MSLRVPVLELEVELTLSGSDPADHIIYLIAGSGKRPTAGTVQEYLNSSRSFFPMSAAGVPRIINKHHIFWMRLPVGALAADDEVTLVRSATIVEMLDGSRLEGYVSIGRAAGQTRLSDVLNDRSLFLRLDETTGTYFVNKTEIRVVIPR
jgi:hypothetical protein